nr:unnamed protein product [Digitaria exilis]
MRNCSSSDNGNKLCKGKGKAKAAAAWLPPQHSWTKINLDGSFVAQTGGAGAGIVAQNSKGKVIFTACQVLHRCSDAAEFEASACVIGLHLAAQWAPGRVMLETDCARAARALQADVDRSELGFIFSEARDYARMLEELKVIQLS